MFCISLFTHTTSPRARAARSLRVVYMFAFVDSNSAHQASCARAAALHDRVVHGPPRVARALGAVRAATQAPRYPSRFTRCTTVPEARGTLSLTSNTARAAIGRSREGSWTAGALVEACSERWLKLVAHRAMYVLQQHSSACK